jgi:ribosome recycling factor
MSMNVTDPASAHAEAERRMDGAVEHVRRELSGVRTGRASVNLLDSVQVDAYGTRMPINQVAGLKVPEPTLIVAEPFDPSQIGAIERAIQGANLGLNPSNDGRVIRIPIPALTDERRQEMSRLVHRLAEEGRTAVRQVRRDANDALKKLLRNHELSEDDERRALDDIQNLTDEHVRSIDDLQKAKDDELLNR